MVFHAARPGVVVETIQRRLEEKNWAAKEREEGRSRQHSARGMLCGDSDAWRIMGAKEVSASWLKTISALKGDDDQFYGQKLAKIVF